MPSLSAVLRTPLAQGVRYAITLTLVGILAYRVDVTTWELALRTAGTVPILGALALAVAAYPLCALRWWMLLRTTQARLSFNRAHVVVWIGQFYNSFLPGGIGGDATRLVYAFREIPNRRAAAIAATAADRMIGFATLLVFATCGLALHGLFTQLPANAWSILASLVFLTLGLVGAIWLLPAVAKRLPETWARPIIDLRGNLAGLASAVGLSAAVWILDFISGWVLAQALGLSYGPVEMGLALAVAYTSTLIPISLGGHGLREVALVLALQWLAPNAGNSTELMSAFALLFLAVNLACSMIGGIILLGADWRSFSRAS